MFSHLSSMSVLTYDNSVKRKLWHWFLVEKLEDVQYHLWDLCSWLKKWAFYHDLTKICQDLLWTLSLLERPKFCQEYQDLAYLRKIYYFSCIWKTRFLISLNKLLYIDSQGRKKTFAMGCLFLFLRSAYETNICVTRSKHRSIIVFSYGVSVLGTSDLTEAVSKLKSFWTRTVSRVIIADYPYFY